MEAAVLAEIMEVPEQFKRGYWEALLQEYLDQCTDGVTWFNYLNFLEEKGKFVQELKAYKNGEVWKNHLGILLEIEKSNDECLNIDFWLQNICEDPANEEEYGARLFKNITGQDAKAKVYFGRRQGYFRFQFDSQADFHLFLREESGKGTIRDIGGFHRQEANLPIRYRNDMGEEHRGRFLIGTLIVIYSLVDTLEEIGDIDNKDVYSAGIDEHERQHWLDGVRKKVLVKAQQNKFRGEISALEKEWGLTEEFPSGLPNAYWHIWTEIFSYTRGRDTIGSIKGPLYQAHYDALKDAYPDFEANFTALQEILDGVHGELRVLVLAQIQTLPMFSFLQQTRDFLEWQERKQSVVKEALGTYHHEANYECVPRDYRPMNSALHLAEVDLHDTAYDVELATMKAEPTLAALIGSYESKKAKCEALKIGFSREGVPIPRLSRSRFELPEGEPMDDPRERRALNALGTEVVDNLLVIPQAEVDEQLGQADAQVAEWLHTKNLITQSEVSEPEIRIIKNDATGIEASYAATINGGRFSVEFRLFRSAQC